MAFENIDGNYIRIKKISIERGGLFKVFFSRHKDRIARSNDDDYQISHSYYIDLDVQDSETNNFVNWVYNRIKSDMIKSDEEKNSFSEMEDVL